MKVLALAFVATLAGATASAEPPCAPKPDGDHLTCVRAKLPAPLTISPLSPDRRTKMRGVTWTEACPISLDALSVVEVPYIDPTGLARKGELVIATTHAAAIQKVFVQLFEARFPIARIEPIENFGGDDQRSMAANNTSGFNCRPGPHPGQWSRHAYGDAIDLNPLWNPQVKGEQISPPQAAAWKDRTVVRPGMHVLGGTAVKIFRTMGWLWGGRWPKPKDYQHFTATGR